MKNIDGNSRLASNCVKMAFTLDYLRLATRIFFLLYVSQRERVRAETILFHCVHYIYIYIYVYKVK